MENKKENPVPLMELELRKINKINKSNKKNNYISNRKRSSRFKNGINF